MTTRMLINATVANELRIAIVEDGELTELDIETSDQNQIKGNIYKGVIHNVEGSLAAAFVDIGGHKQGFLPFDEISPKLYTRKSSADESPRITDVIKRGQEIVVQVAKDAVGEKGATLTTYLSLPGRFSVLMPGSDANGVSRKIEDDVARKKIRAMAAKIERPEDCGFIVRTAGLGQPRAAIQKDLDAVVAIYEKVQKSAQIARAPSLLYAEPDLISRTLRDFFNDDIDEVWIDTRDEYEAARAYFESLMPQYLERIQFYQNPIPIFAYYHVEEQIEATFHRTVALPSGGSIVIDQTEALVAIDVNSGKNTSERDHEDTVFKTNLEAAQEVARQLKLRDLGGIIVIDFIDMELRKNERLVEKALVEAAKEDKARYKISKINAQGLCVLTRQRIRQGLRKSFQRTCQVCAGTGWLRTPESHSLSLLRRLEARLAQGGVGEARVMTHRETAEYIQNNKRAEIMALEREYHARILVFARAEMDRNSDDVTYLSKGEVLAEITDRLPPREERLDRLAKRRKKRKKREAALEAAAAEAGEESEEGAAPRAEGERKKKRRRKREASMPRGREESTSRGREEGVSGEAASAAAPAEAASSGIPERKRSREPRPEGRFDGTGEATFTGRPPPAVLERLKAERRARLAGRKAQSPTEVAPEGAPGSVGVEASGEAMPARERDAEPAYAWTPPRHEPAPFEAVEDREPAEEPEPEPTRERAPRASMEVREPAAAASAEAPAEVQRPRSLFERLGVLREPAVPPPDSDVG